MRGATSTPVEAMSSCSSAMLTPDDLTNLVHCSLDLHNGDKYDHYDRHTHQPSY